MRVELEAIGVVHSPFRQRVDAPRQAPVAGHVEGTVELFSGRGYEDALCDLACWSHVWLVVWFHHNQGFRPKVQPPRSAVKRGVLATRAPYRPNPIGLSAVRLLAIEGLVLRVQGLDLLDGTPLLDVKPYVPYSDAIPDASHGWLDQLAAQTTGRPADPLPAYAVRYAPLALVQLDSLPGELAVALRARIDAALALGPSPHAYRRIRREGTGFVLAAGDFRAVFVDAGERALCVTHLRSGYKPRELAEGGSAPEHHRAFVARFGLDGNRP